MLFNILLINKYRDKKDRQSYRDWFFLENYPVTNELTNRDNIPELATLTEITKARFESATHNMSFSKDLCHVDGAFGLPTVQNEN